MMSELPRNPDNAPASFVVLATLIFAIHLVAISLQMFVHNAVILCLFLFTLVVCPSSLTCMLLYSKRRGQLVQVRRLFVVWILELALVVLLLIGLALPIIQAAR